MVAEGVESDRRERVAAGALAEAPTDPGKRQ